MGPSDEEGGKEAKRQKSEPTTPISSSSRLPHEYDEVMGITQVDPREAERFEEGLDSEYHDATEEPQDIERPDPAHMPRFSHGGCGSSSLRECIELLNHTRGNSPATLHSGVKTEKKSDPPHNLLGKWGISLRPRLHRPRSELPELTEFSPRNSVRAKKLTELGV